MTSPIQFSFKKYFLYRKRIYKFFAFGIIFIICLFILSYLVTRGKNFADVYYAPQEYHQLDYDIESELYFNSVFNENSDIYRVIIDTINSAQHSLSIVAYSISHPEIIRLLNEKKKSGVQVEVIVPSSKDTQHMLAFGLTEIEPIAIGKKYHFKSIAEESDVGESLMHHKFIVTDYGHHNATLLFGSMNFTDFQVYMDAGFILETKDEYMIDTFMKEFNLLKSGISGTRKLVHKNFQPFSYLGEYTNGSVELWFGPGYKKNSTKYKMIDTIHKAEKDIKVLGWRIHDRDIMNALVQKSREGVPVVIIIDDFYAWDKHSLFFNILAGQTNVEIITDSYAFLYLLEQNIESSSDFNPYLHHHTLIVDDSYLLAGTNNWTERGFYINDESFIATDVPEIVTYYRDEFDFLYEKLAGKELININNISQLETDRSILFQEKSNPLSVGNICSFNMIDESIEICNKETPVRFFVINKHGELEKSGYISQE